MYLGRIVEIGEANEIYDNPKHPYTKILMSAIPLPDPDKKLNVSKIKGEIPSPLNPPSGCTFRTRCPMAQQICAEKVPELVELKPGYACACHFVKPEKAE